MEVPSASPATAARAAAVPADPALVGGLAPQALGLRLRLPGLPPHQPAPGRPQPQAALRAAAARPGRRRRRRRRRQSGAQSAAAQVLAATAAAAPAVPSLPEPPAPVRVSPAPPQRPRLGEEGLLQGGPGLQGEGAAQGEPVSTAQGLSGENNNRGPPQVVFFPTGKIFKKEHATVYLGKMLVYPIIFHW